MKALPSLFTRKVKLENLGEEQKKQWGAFAQLLRDKIKNKSPELTAQSTPETNFSFDTKVKDKVKSEYNWSDNAKKFMDETKLKDVSNKFSENDLENMQLNMSRFNVAGTYHPVQDYIKNYMPDIGRDNENTFAHEMLHRFFQHRSNTIADSPALFNNDWEAMKIRLGNSTLSGDAKNFNEMKKIDKLLLEGDAYPRISQEQDLQSLANERFAHFGANTKAKDWDGGKAPELDKYYEGIINN